MKQGILGLVYVVFVSALLVSSVAANRTLKGNATNGSKGSKGSKASKSLKSLKASKSGPGLNVSEAKARLVSSVAVNHTGSSLKRTKVGVKEMKTPKNTKITKTMKSEVTCTTDNAADMIAASVLVEHHNANKDRTEGDCERLHSEEHYKGKLAYIVDKANTVGTKTVNHYDVLDSWCPEPKKNRRELKLALLHNRKLMSETCEQDVIDLSVGLIGLALSAIGISNIDGAADNVASLIVTEPDVLNGIIGQFSSCSSNDDFGCYAKAIIMSFFDILKDSSPWTVVKAIVENASFWAKVEDVAGFVASIAAFIVTGGLSEIVTVTGAIVAAATVISDIIQLYDDGC